MRISSHLFKITSLTDTSITEKSLILPKHLTMLMLSNHSSQVHFLQGISNTSETI